MPLKLKVLADITHVHRQLIDTQYQMKAIKFIQNLLDQN